MKLLLLALAAMFIFLGGSCFYYCGPGGSGLLASHSLKNGGEILVTQKWTGWVEPYEVSVWYKEEGQEEWLWDWIDYEQFRWRDTRIEEEDGGDFLLVYEGEELWLRFVNHNRPFDPDYEPISKARRTFGPDNMAKGYDPYGGKQE